MSRITQHEIKFEKNLWMNLLLLAIAILGFLINGYSYGISDQALYIPMIHKSINPSLFTNDHLFNEPSGGYNFWLPTVAFLARFFSMEWIFFVGYVFAWIMLFWAVYHISLNLFDSRGSAIFAVILLLIVKPVGATATSTLEGFFTLRSTAMPFALVFLIPYFRGRLLIASIICGITFLIHPITAIPLVCLLILRLLVNCFYDDWRISAKAFGAFVLCILPLLIWVLLMDRANHSDLSFFSRSDPEWLKIIRQRDSYVFLSAWKKDSFISLSAYYILLIAVLLFRRWYAENHGTDFWAYTAIIVCVVLFIVGFVFVEWYPLPLVVQLQVIRSSYLVINLALIYAAWLLWEGIQRWREVFDRASGHKLYSIIRRFVFLPIGIIIPLCIATLFIDRLTNQLVLGAVSVIFWFLCLHFGKLHFLWRSGFGLLYIAIIIMFRKYFVKALDWHTIRIVLIAFAVFQMVYFVARWRDWARIKKVAISFMLFVIILALVGIRLDVLKQTLFKGQFTQRINLPNRIPRNDWIDVQKWCKQNTPVDAIFLTPPDIGGFRIYSQRTIIGDSKDGAPCVFSESYAKNWQARMEELGSYNSFDEKQFGKLREKYGCSFAVVRKLQKLDFPIVYQNNSYIIHSLDDTLPL